MEDHHYLYQGVYGKQFSSESGHNGFGTECVLVKVSDIEPLYQVHWKSWTISEKTDVCHLYSLSATMLK